MGGGAPPINRKYISYEMQAMYVGPSGAMQTPGNASGVTKLDFIQSYGFSFDIDRAALKQIGSDFYATRQTQLTPDVNLNINYYLDQGWNEKFIGMDVGGTIDGYKNPFSGMFTANQDRNFYIIIADDNRVDLNSKSNFAGDQVLGIGNAYLRNFDLNIGINSLATVDLSFVASNAYVHQFEFNVLLSGVEYVGVYNPAVYQTGSGTTVIGEQLMAPLNQSRSSRYMTGYKEIFNGGCPYSACSITATTSSSNGLSFGFDFDNFQSLSISIPFERKSLYGFGNNSPFDRKILKPVIGTLNIDSMVKTFNTENLQQNFNAEDKGQLLSGYNFDIIFSNYTGLKKFGVKIQNARLDSYSIGAQIGDQSIISTSWSFEVNERTGVLMSGSYAPPVPVVNYITEAINL
jgi:hypothetical protein